MTRSQSILLAILLVLSALVFGRTASPALAPLLVAVRDGLVGPLSTVPVWVWWTVAGALWWLPWTGCGCGRSGCAARPAS